MARQYQQVKPPRFVVEFVDGAEQIRIKAPRNWLLLPFVSFWLLIWTIGGVLAIGALAQGFDLFLLVWLCGWALGWVFAAGTIAWQIGGAEIVRAIGGDLEIGYAMPGLSRRRLFRGSEIARLSTVGGGTGLFGRLDATYPPFLSFPKGGSIRFDHGARTYHFAAGLDEAEAAMIVDHLRKRLPAGAMEKRQA